MAAATFGLVAGGLLGSPVGTRLITRFGLKPAPTPVIGTPRGFEAAAVNEELEPEAAGEAPTAYLLLKVLAVILVCMWLGGLLSSWLGQYVTLPGYIGAMIVAAVFRNLADVTKAVRIEARVVDDIGTIALSLFLTMALMSLKLWELLDLAVPMLAILVVQVVLLAIFTYWVTFRVMGKDYDAAVMAAGHCGFGLGATPNAVANMRSLEERFGPAPRAFLVIPMVGAFFIDFTNAIIITAYINLVKP
jgi:ESS family glutamate:Na+ symporter